MSELVRGWIAPGPGGNPRVRVVTTTRVGGVAPGPRSTLDLGHAGDRETAAFATNRRRLQRALALPGEPCWLRQQHGTEVVEIGRDDPPGLPAADAAWTQRPGVVCAVLTADCLPVLLADRDGQAVGIAHAGWRGLAGGVIEALAEAMAPARLHAWLGPAIGPRAFEVGPEVRAAFVDPDPAAAGAFQRGRGDRWFADLYCLARHRLRGVGVDDISGGGHCTFIESHRFFSYRRDGAGTGRMATLAWIAPSD